MLLLYNIGIRIYYLAIFISSLFNQKARLWIQGRKNLFNIIKSAITPDESIIWFHCSSLGEFEQGRPVLEKIKRVLPDRKILLTFYSPSGYEIRKNYQVADYVFYIPLDTRKNARRFIELIHPEKVFFVKYEFWYHFLHELHKRSINTYLISGIFRSNQIFFKWYGKWFRRILKSFNHLFVQNKDSEEILQSIKISNISISGDTRFDRVYALSRKASDLPLMSTFKGKKKILIAGSTWPKDEELLIKYINMFQNDVKYIIAPHEIHPHTLIRLENTIRKETVRFTECNHENIASAEVLIVDTIGYLSSLYQYGDIAYMGGGFGKGIHNTLEAATFGLPVIFGPNYQNFREAIDLIHYKAAFPIYDYKELEHVIHTLLSDDELLKSSGQHARQYVLSMIGATDHIVESVLEHT